MSKISKIEYELKHNVVILENKNDELKTLNEEPRDNTRVEPIK